VTSVAAVGGIAGLLVFASVIRLVLLERMRVRYAGLWLVVGAAVVLLALVPGLLAGTASLLGFVVPANLLFLAGLVLLLLVGIHLSVAVTALEDHVQRLAEEVVLLVEDRDREVEGQGRDGYRHLDGGRGRHGDGDLDGDRDRDRRADLPAGD